jgi:hypothetical protein
MRNASPAHQDQRRGAHQYRAQTIGVEYAGELSGEIKRRYAGQVEYRHRNDQPDRERSGENTRLFRW